MPKFIVQAKEMVFSSAVMEAGSLDELKTRLANGSFEFNDFQLGHPEDFVIESIEEIENA